MRKCYSCGRNRDEDDPSYERRYNRFLVVMGVFVTWLIGDVIGTIIGGYPELLLPYLAILQMGYTIGAAAYCMSEKFARNMDREIPEFLQRITGLFQKKEEVNKNVSDSERNSE